MVAGSGKTLQMWNSAASSAPTLKPLRKSPKRCCEPNGQNPLMTLYGASGLRTRLRQSIIHDKGRSTTGSKRQLSRPITQGEVLGFMATGHPGTQVPQKIGTVGGSPSEHALLKNLAGSKSSWILPPTTETLHDSPGS